MTDDMDATGPEYAKALSHPTRHRLLLELNEDGATISQLANRLTTNKGNIVHHLNVLIRAGLVRRGRTRTVRGGTEQYYVRAAKRIRFDLMPDSLVAMMSNLTEELAGDQHALFNHRVLRLTSRQADALAAHLDAIVNNLEPASDRDQRYGVIVSVFRHGRNPHGRLAREPS
jgi:predicted ArsR family transcriptional regulator